jgi:tetratricopeptide (TPR) repeat protein
MALEIPSKLMPKYTWTAKNKSGQTVVKEITANTASEAQAILVTDGFSDLKLKEDEIMTIVQAGFSERPKMFGEEIKQPTTGDRLKAMESPTVTFLDVIRKGIWQSKGLIFLILLLFTYQVYRGNFASAILLIASLVVWLAFLICVGLPSVYYRKLILAADWSRWKEVLSLVDTLKAIGRIGLIKVPVTELTRYRAKAFVGMGRLQDGLAEYQQCEGRPDCPSWLYKLFVASLYTTAKQYDKAIEYNLKAIEENSGSTPWADLSYRYARYKRNPQKAREAMAEADKSPMAEIAKPFRIRCLGVIAYLEGDYDTARHELETAIEVVEKVKWRPFKDGHLSIARAYLCCVLAKQGDLSAAKKKFALAKDYLVATEENELLAECRRATGEYN